MKKYQPSNGTEGLSFMERFCFLCEREQGNNECDILGRTMYLTPADKGYPIEWTYDKNGQPICTAWRAVGTEELHPDQGLLFEEGE